MSLRPLICGFDLGKLRSLLGSGDRALIAAIEADFDRRAAQYPAQYNDRFRARFREALRTAVLQGVPFPDLEAETEPHVELAILLASHQQEFLGTDSDAWNNSGFSEAWEEGITDDTDSEEDLLGHLLFGRPLFGSYFETSWSYYGYLSRDEVRRLRASLRPVDDEDDPPGQLACKLIGDLRRWCDTLLKAEKDLWCSWG
jgi:hypothetical protein